MGDTDQRSPHPGRGTIQRSATRSSCTAGVVEGPDAGLGMAGRLPLDPLGPRCPEGHRGCALAMLAIPSLCAAASVALRRDVSYDECLDLAAAGDPVATPLVTAAGRALGRLIATVTSLTLTNTVILTGEGIRPRRGRRNGDARGRPHRPQPPGHPGHHPHPAHRLLHLGPRRGGHRDPAVRAGRGGGP
jgi:predicted NBD/HSP70 family sugar kinase